MFVLKQNLIMEIPQMEWSTDVMLRLVDAYRDHPELWDPSHKFYRLNSRKNDSWVEIATMFNSDVLQVKRKINSLLASFRRERHKVRLGHVGVGGRKNYQSSWFAFDKFSFLFDKDRWKFEQENCPDNFVLSNEQTEEQTTLVLQDELQDDDQNAIKIEANSLDEDENNLIAELVNEEEPEEQNVQIQKVIRPQIRPRFKNKANNDSSVLKAFKMLQKVSTKQRHECDVYGEYIASKLRKYNDRTRAVVQHAINNVLFDADMGKYEGTEYVYASVNGSSSQDSQDSTQFQQTPFPSSDQSM